MTSQTPTVAILGPGAVGGALAVLLARAGVEVICVARADTAAGIRSEGLTLRQGPDSLSARPEAVEELRRPVDLLVITVKAPQLSDALERVDGGGPFLPLLNGLEHVDTIRERLGEPVIVGSVSRFEAYRESPTSIVQTTPGGVLTVSSPDPVDLLERSGFDVRVESAERVILWEKVARLAPLAAVTAIAQRPVGELRSDAEWRETLAAAIEETCAVAGADGVEVTPVAQWAIIDAMPDELTTSTARDVFAGRRSELDAITGGVVRAGRRLGVPTPVLERLLMEADEACRQRSR
jgi:2-dehydropantoate 2-reductase